LNAHVILRDPRSGEPKDLFHEESGVIAMFQLEEILRFAQDDV
jgi:hypothetical protein